MDAPGLGNTEDPEVLANLVLMLHRLGPRLGARPTLTTRLCERIRGSSNRTAAGSRAGIMGPITAPGLPARRSPDCRRRRGALEAGHTFLRRARRAAGWGSGTAPDALSTALAAMTLGVDVRAELAAMQQEDGLWPAVPFIRMELGRAEGTVRQVLTYSSRLVTAAFAIRALIAGNAEKP